MYRYFLIFVLFFIVTQIAAQVQWINYSTGNTGNNSITDNFIESLYADRQGRLWIGTFRGLSVFDGENWREINMSSLPGNHINDIMEDKNGNIWISTYDGIGKFKGNEWWSYADKDGLPNRVVMDIAEDLYDNLWFATYGQILKFDGKNRETFLAGDNIAPKYWYRSIDVDHEGRVWTATETMNIYVFDQGEWTEQNMRGSEIYVDKQGHILIGTYGAFHYSDPPDPRISCFV